MPFSSPWDLLDPGIKTASLAWVGRFFTTKPPGTTSYEGYAAAAAKLLQLCLTLGDPIDGSPPGSPVPGILQARTLEWVAISFSNAWKWKVKVKSLSHVGLFETPWTAAYQPPPSMGFSRQEYQSGLPLPSSYEDYKLYKMLKKCSEGFEVIDHLGRVYVTESFESYKEFQFILMMRESIYCVFIFAIVWWYRYCLEKQLWRQYARLWTEKRDWK